RAEGYLFRLAPADLQPLDRPADGAAPERAAGWLRRSRSRRERAGAGPDAPRQSGASPADPGPPRDPAPGSRPWHAASRDRAGRRAERSLGGVPRGRDRFHAVRPRRPGDAGPPGPFPPGGGRLIPLPHADRHRPGRPVAPAARARGGPAGPPAPVDRGRRRALLRAVRGPARSRGPAPASPRPA